MIASVYEMHIYIYIYISSSSSSSSSKRNVDVFFLQVSGIETVSETNGRTIFRGNDIKQKAYCRNERPTSTYDSMQAPK